jgi:hypothetical protein
MTRARKAVDKPYAVIDCETDPFKHGSKISPYMWGYYDGCAYRSFWGDDCTGRLLAFLDNLPNPLQIFAHNGGKFDFMFFFDILRGEAFIINGRIVDIPFGKHTLSDSYARIPVALGKFEGAKKAFDVKRHGFNLREQYRQEILDYNEQDCVGLYDVLAHGFQQFGRNWVTMASKAFTMGNKAMRESSPVAGTYVKLDPKQDAYFRSFYFGGRVQLFAKGVIECDLLCVDANSMYPAVMCNYDHPVGALADYSTCDVEDCDFAVVKGYSAGALPLLRENKLGFPNAYAEYHATGHEIRAGLELGRLKIDKVISSIKCRHRMNFEPYIKPLYQERLLWKHRKDLHKTGTENWPEASMMDEFCKLRMNSYYGKYGMNPAKYREYLYASASEATPEPVTETCSLCRGKGNFNHLPCYSCDGAGTRLFIWELHGGGVATRVFSRPIDGAKGYKNVAIAASITGAARSVLLRSLDTSNTPLYCDTDSITAADINDTILDRPEKIKGVTIPQLGKWKIEVAGNRIALAAKKVYAIFDGQEAEPKIRAKRMKDYGDETCVKLACKGVRLKAPEIIIVANGGVVTWRNDAPSIGVYNGDHKYIQRRVGLNPPTDVEPFPEKLDAFAVRRMARV